MLVFSVESKSGDVTGTAPNNYCVYLDIKHSDNTETYAVMVPFKTGANDWRKAGKTYPKKSVKEVDLNPFAEHVLLPQDDVKFSVIKQVEVSPMNPEDAAYEMERLGYSFWIFLDEDSKQINLIFKRLDGTYGLIKPVKKK